MRMCEYEYLIDGSESIWCKFFSQSVLQLQEYREDMQSYCKFGFKHSISRLMTCDLVKDLVAYLNTALNG